MACRVGITTDEAARKQYWQGKHTNFRRWQIISTHRTKTAAQVAETKRAREHGCKSHPGGGGEERATWKVYHFFY